MDVNMPTDFDTFFHLEKLLDDFPSCCRAARELPTPNAEDDEFIRCGIIGFSRHMSLDHWSRHHFEYVRMLRDEVTDGRFPENWVRFCCLAGGYFLGMAEAGAIDESSLRLAEAHTPGFMWKHAQAFD